MVQQVEPVFTDIGSGNANMRAVVYDDYGDADVLHVAEISVPRRLPGQILIEVWASSVNPIDYPMRRGEMKGLLPMLKLVVPSRNNGDRFLRSLGD